jgi:hypothetical protein
MKKALCRIVLASCLVLSPAANAALVFTLDSTNGAISGPAGTTIGWGFTFANDTNYAVITGTQFCDSNSNSLPDICVPPVPNPGSYQDFAGTQFLVVGAAPESLSITQAFDNALLTGIGAFTLDPSASGTVSGILVLTYDLFRVSPNDPNFSFDDQISGGNFVTAAASVTVAAVAPVPEPGTSALLCAGLSFLVLLHRLALSERRN